MAGEAKTDAFLLSSASIMIGPQASLWDLNPSAHGLGLSKNFVVSADPTYKELSQGIKNTKVFSVMTDNPVKASAEVYEYTPKNLSYGLGLSSSGLVGAATSATSKNSIAAAATTLKISSVTDNSTDWPVDAWFTLQPASSEDLDKIHVAKISAVSYDAVADELTVTYAGYAIPSGVTYAAGDVIRRVDNINIGDKTAQPFFGAKVVGLMPADNKPVTILFPKVRITKGFNLALNEAGDFGSLPFEFTPYELVSTDTFYSEFKNKGVARLVVTARA